MTPIRRAVVWLVAGSGLALCLCAQTGSADDQDLKYLLKLKQAQPALEKGIDRYTAGDRAGARRQMEKCLQALPLHHQARFMLAQISYDEKGYDAALGHIADAETGFQRFRAVMANQEQILRKVRDGKQQEMTDFTNALFQRAASACNPDFWKRESRALETQASAERNQNTDVKEDLLQVPAEYSYLHGNILFRLQRLSEAEAFYIHAIDANPQHAASYNNLINLHFVSRRFEEARRWVARAEANQVELNRALVEALGRAG